MIRLKVSGSHLRLNVNPQKIGMKIGQAIVVSVGGEPYEGEYEVTPRISSQTLATAKKLMQDDVTIKAIPYFDVSNTAGGQTIYIGSEL